MKKLAIAIFAVVCVAMFIAPAYADDRVSLYGTFRTRAWNITDSNGDESSFVDQRLRIGTRINIADDVYVEMRGDYGEGTWGKDYMSGLGSSAARPRGADGNTFSKTFDLDRAFLNIDKEMWSLRVGQQYIGLGIMSVLDANVTGAKLVLKLPVKTSLIYAKIEDDADDENDIDDTDLYGINFSYDTDAYSFNMFGVTVDDGSDEDNNPLMYGIHGTGTLGMVNLTSELAFGDGDVNDDIDYMGTQFFLQGNADINEAFNLGAEFYYALGTDDDDELQLTTLSNWGGDFFIMSLNTPFAADFTAFDGDSVFDATGDNAGIIGLTVFGSYKLMDALSMGAKVGYFEPEEDDVTSVDDITTFNVWASYMLATNTELALAYLYSDYDDSSATEHDDASEIIVARLQVSF